MNRGLEKLKRQLRKVNYIARSAVGALPVQKRVEEIKDGKISLDQVENYWEAKYKSDLLSHSDQNKFIVKDFLSHVKKHRGVYETLNSAQSALEVGCGTGDALFYFYEAFGFSKGLGIDLSAESIEFARERYSHSGLAYEKNSGLSDLSVFGRFDLTICSNTLEHFADPYKLLNQMLSVSDNCLVLVPYNQPCIDGYDGEGGAGHVFTFTEQSFKEYEVQGSFTFRTDGWQYSSCGETPKQLAVLMKRRKS